MGKQHITETLVCGNCIHASPTNGCGKGIRICHQTGQYVNENATFCIFFVADWVIDDTPLVRQKGFSVIDGLAIRAMMEGR